MLLLISSVALAENRYRLFGAQFDVGVPDGVALGAIIRPVNWAHLNLSGTYNAMAPGIRGGFTLDPIKFPIAPSVTVEGGYAFPGKIPGVEKVPAFDYDYLNLHAGLEFGHRDRWRLFLHAGPTAIHLQTSNFQSVAGSNQSSLKIGDPSVNATVFPTAKLGFAVYF